MPGFTGGCLCGAVRYEVGGDPARMVNCHCDDCRKVTGAAFATNIFVEADQINVLQGKVTTFEHTADSGSVRVKEFCGTCGSQLFNYGASRPSMKSIKVGSIDDAHFVQPTTNLYVARALPYSYIDDALKNFDEMPTG